MLRWRYNNYFYATIFADYSRYCSTKERVPTTSFVVPNRACYESAKLFILNAIELECDHWYGECHSTWSSVSDACYSRIHLWNVYNCQVLKSLILYVCQDFLHIPCRIF